MATTDINGMVFYANTDPVTSLNANINAISTAVTNAFNSETRTFRVANQAARDALLVSRGASASAPLQVDRADTGNTERNVTGLSSGWTTVAQGLWLPWTPVLTAAGGNPSGYTAVGRYIRIGNTVNAQFTITLGSSNGSGTYALSYPGGTANSATASGIGTVRLYDSSTGQAVLGARIGFSSTTTVGFQYTSGTPGPLGNASSGGPWVWAGGDIMDGFMTFEVF